MQCDFLDCGYAWFLFGIVSTLAACLVILVILIWLANKRG